ncbi:17.6 kDa class I heat shock protein-like [Malus sylvestris]|uniref:17.6 kDa class I heat shock protein-like n=1 Tax=Malus sylvestris TaxID=3752 RepID=UPI0021ABD062|nr:17.6 kDa class I heat shock protein-like [Malus sylvestris]
MSIVPINERRGTDDFDNLSSALDLWDPFTDFPFRAFPFHSPISNVFRDFNPFSSVNSRLDWRETRNAHVLTAALPAFANEEVLVSLEDERVLQISTDSGSFTTRMKLPDDARIEELKAFMSNGVLTVTVPKLAAAAGSRDVRVIEISGDD